MRISDITEATDFITLKPTLDSFIHQSLDDTIAKFKQEFNTKQLEKLRDGDTAQTTINAFAHHLTNIFAKESVERLTTIGSNAVNYPIKVVWREMGIGEASANKNVIAISIKYLQMIYDTIKRILADHTKRSEGDSVYWDAIYIITQTHFVDTIRTKLPVKILKLSSIFMHELVHIQQHARQDFRSKTEYRSYLSDPKNPTEFTTLADKQVMSLPESNRYRKLYLASPQEIDAFAHNIAYDIIDDEMLDWDLDDLPSLNELAQKIGQYATRKFGKPTNKIEMQIWKRYVKKTTILVDKYLDRKK